MVHRNTEFVAYCCVASGSKEGAVAGKLAAVNFYHEQWMERLLPLASQRIKAVKDGSRKPHAGAGNQPRGEEAVETEGR